MPTKILIVDDSQLIHRMYAMALRSYRRPIEPHYAGDGYEALKQLHAHPDTALILLDVNMPLMSGLEVLERLKAEPVFAAIPVVLQSTEDQAGDVQRGLAVGARAYLTKPFTPQRLQALLDDLLEPVPQP